MVRAIGLVFVMVVLISGEARGTTVGGFVERAKLLVSDGSTNDEFSQFATSGDTIVVTGPGTNPGPTAPIGRAYVFVKPPGGWFGTLFEQATLFPTDGAPGDQFARVAMDGDVIVVGSYEDNIGANGNVGSAYVFVKPPGGWSGTIGQVAWLRALDGRSNDIFGLRVAVSGDVIVATARFANSPQNDQGAAYVFVKPAAGWSGSLTERAILIASGARPNDQFGSAVAIRGDTIVIGAFFHDATATTNSNEGAAYVFQKPATANGWFGTLTQSATLVASAASAGDFLGTVVALHGDTVVVGAPQSLEPTVAGPGAAYVFEKPAAGWSGTLTETAKLSASGGVLGDRFGVSVALDSDTIVVGADSTEVGENTNQGSVYVFEKPATGWSGELTAPPALTAQDGAAGNLFGQQLALNGDTLFVGAPFDDIDSNTNQGSVYAFVQPPAPVPATSSPLLAVLAFAFFASGAMLLRRSWVA